MNFADKFREVFNRRDLGTAETIFQCFIQEYIASPWCILINFTDGSTFRYYI